jgi:hypothetical protein
MRARKYLMLWRLLGMNGKQDNRQGEAENGSAEKNEEPKFGSAADGPQALILALMMGTTSICATHQSADGAVKIGASVRTQ